MLKTLRLIEWQPENKRPFVLIEAQGTGEEEICLRATAKVEADYTALAKGLLDDGIALAPLPKTDPPMNLDSLTKTLRNAARQVAGVLDGLVFVWIPARPDETPLYAKIASALAAVSDGSVLRIALVDRPGLEATFPGVARFQVDQPALLQYLKDLGREKSGGPGAKPVQLTPTEKAAIERELGKPILSEATGFDLRAYLLDAAAALQNQDFKLATKKFRAARMLCHGSGLHDEEATISVALGSAVFGAGDRRAAIAAYLQGKAIALGQNNLALAAQAELGVAAVHLASADYPKARETYAEVRRLATELPALGIEALRMMGDCFVYEKRLPDAIASYGEALEVATALPPEVRARTSYAHAGRALMDALVKQGQSAAAASVKGRLTALGEADVRGASDERVKPTEAQL